jgi:hypothetical protein
MASGDDIYRKVKPRLWVDAKVRRLSKPQPNGQSLFLYLLTARESCALPGALELLEETLAARLGWPLDGMRDAMAEVIREGLAVADWEAGLVWLPGGLKNNPLVSPQQAKTWAEAFDRLPESPLKDRILLDVLTYADGVSDAMRDAIRRAFPHPCAIQEQEQEQKQEQQQEQEGEAAPPAPRRPRLAVPPPPPSPAAPGSYPRAIQIWCEASNGLVDFTKIRLSEKNHHAAALHVLKATGGDEAEITRLAANFWADPWHRDNVVGFPYFASNLSKWESPPKPKKTKHAPAPNADDYTDEEWGVTSA